MGHVGYHVTSTSINKLLQKTVCNVNDCDIGIEKLLVVCSASTYTTDLTLFICINVK